jgi:glycosyltransferase involved in cell wall biosynthesis
MDAERDGASPSAAPAPRFAVITITYNNLGGLQQTWASVAAQTLGDFEWVVVDGGSTDGTVEWLEALDDARVSWKSGPDGGIYPAMNKGIDRATGDIMIFMNAGDVFSNAHVLERFSASQQHLGWRWAYGVMRYVDDAGEVLGLHFSPRFTINDLRLGLRFIGHQAAFFTRELVHEVGHYREEFGFAGDQEFMLRAAHVAPPAPVAELVGDFLMGGVSDGVAPDYFIKASRQMRQVNDEQVMNSVVDAGVTGALVAQRRARTWLRDAVRGARTAGAR